MGPNNNYFVEYFTHALDASMYITYAILTLALVILDWPKEYNRKSVPILLAKLVGVYAFYVFFESLAFALGLYMAGNGGMMIFTASFIVAPAIFVPIFLKESTVHKIIKIFIIAASVLTVGQIVRLLIDIFDTVYGGVSPDYINILCRLFPYSILVFISKLLKHYDIGRYKNLTKSQIFIMIFGSVVLITISILEANIDTEIYYFRWLLIIIDGASLFILIYMYFSMHSAMEKRHRITTLEVQSSILELEKDSLEIDRKNREELMKIRHDLNNQLSYVNALLSEGKNEEAHQYLQGLLEQKQEYLESFSCSNVVISGIVNLELTKAKIAGKKIKFRAVVPPRLPFEDADLLSLITNIADNCIENFVPEDDKDKITISILTQNDYLRIVSYNTVDTGKMSTRFLSTTKSGKDHGYGTKIIRNIVDKYRGHSSFSIDGNKFVCDCILDMSYRGENNA